MSKVPIHRPTHKATTIAKLRIGSRIGKYRLDRRMGSGGFATVYAATDTLLGIKVALKIPSAELVSPSMLEEFRREARLTMKLDHPNILPIRDASFIDGQFVIVSPLAERTLDDRLSKRMAFETAFNMIEQVISGVAHAHQRGVIHCDIKPENILLFDDNVLRLADFGIAKAAQKTISASGTGTVGYMAPEQAMGKPSARSDVFSIGLIAYRMFSSKWPEYPFTWPMAGSANLRKRAHPDLIVVIRKTLEILPRHRYRDANALLADWEKVRLKAIRFARR
ncbi:Serine/threonine-protein kinase PrkC [Rubripirellula tenax]|uniref:Serine/threonine-protein kinase PrkC n=1 Tax=Rubripirellula tenax TaxID=2528015 RepID=A0A5C6FKU3_9BACT|nr:serine/threonine-protein kinase [Rubripirellula tenax]TWU60232.1 Serine/threonine-protein kinase PrkC [Rubripirellula tenax]